MGAHWAGRTAPGEGKRMWGSRAWVSWGKEQKEKKRGESRVVNKEAAGARDAAPGTPTFPSTSPQPPGTRESPVRGVYPWDGTLPARWGPSSPTAAGPPSPATEPWRVPGPRCYGPPPWLRPSPQAEVKAGACAVGSQGPIPPRIPLIRVFPSRRRG
jgi:hypothetical protein